MPYRADRSAGNPLSLALNDKQNEITGTYSRLLVGRSVCICPLVLRICSQAGYSNLPPHGSPGGPVGAPHRVFEFSLGTVWQKGPPERHVFLVGDSDFSDAWVLHRGPLLLRRGARS